MKYVCNTDTYTNGRLYKAGVVYDCDKAPNEHFTSLVAQCASEPVDPTPSTGSTPVIRKGGKR